MIGKLAHFALILKDGVDFSQVVFFLGDENVVLIQFTDHFSSLFLGHSQIFILMIGLSCRDFLINFFEVDLVDTSKAFLAVLGWGVVLVLLLLFEV